MFGPKLVTNSSQTFSLSHETFYLSIYSGSILCVWWPISCRFTWSCRFSKIGRQLWLWIQSLGFCGRQKNDTDIDHQKIIQLSQTLAFCITLSKSCARLYWIFIVQILPAILLSIVRLSFTCSTNSGRSPYKLASAGLQSAYINEQIHSKQPKTYSTDGNYIFYIKQSIETSKPGIVYQTSS